MTWTAIRTGVVKDLSQFFKDLSLPFYGFNKPGAKVSEGVPTVMIRMFAKKCSPAPSESLVIR